MPKLFYSVFIFLILFIPHIEVFADFSFIRYSTNPVVSTSSNTWNNKIVGTPSVISNGQIYTMLFTGYGDNGYYQVGIAKSYDGINWIINDNPITSRLQQYGENTHDPNIIYFDSKYFAWYMATINSSTKLIMATSEDTNTWVESDTTFVHDKYWNNGSISSPSILKIGQEYKMWYAGTASGYPWQIGYATSTDGVNWTQYGNEPVIKKDKGWENAQLVGPTVYYDSSTNTYHMWYTTNWGGSNISYAYSSDGINWIKPDSNPILIPTQNDSFDKDEISDSSILKINETYFLWYSGKNGSIMNIGLAYSGIQPTPYLTPTPTPTPSPTPTPTPTPIPVTKVVVVPGFAGSMNWQQIYSCGKDDSATWSSWKLSELIYPPIIKALSDAGYIPLPFYYDWRKDPRDSAEDLKRFISSHTQSDEKIYLVGHSFGGLVSRAYIDDTKGDSRIAKYISVGTPHEGTPYAYPAWAAGEVWGDPNWTTGATIAKFFCKLKNPRMSDKDIIHSTMPSVQTILPITPYLRHFTRGILLPIESMVNKNNFLPDPLFTPDLYGILAASLAGKNLPTMATITVMDPTNTQKRKHIYEDGRPIFAPPTPSGDGTITTDSSTLDGATNYSLELDHGKLISSNQGIQTIFDFLGISKPSTITSTEPIRSAIGFVSDEGEMHVSEPKAYKIAPNFIIIPDPLALNQLIEFIPGNKPMHVLVFQTIPTINQTLTQELTIPANRRTKKNLRFNPNKLTPSIVK